MKYNRYKFLITPKRLRSFSFILRTFFTPKKVKHFIHSVVEAISVDGFYFCSGEIGGDMGNNTFFFDKVVAMLLHSLLRYLRLFSTPKFKAIVFLIVGINISFCKGMHDIITILRQIQN